MAVNKGAFSTAFFNDNTNPRTVNPNSLPLQNGGKRKYFVYGGGAKIDRSKLNKISAKYKMARKSKKQLKRIKRRLTKKYLKRRGGKRSSSMSMRGGTYTQYGSNIGYSSGYTTGGIQLSANESALANPAPITPYKSPFF